MSATRMWMVAVTVAMGLPVQAQAPQYRARLSVVPIDIAMQATIAGSGTITAALKGATLTINGTFTGLKTPATVVRVHRGPKTAMRGPAIGDLIATAATSGTITGSIELTTAQAGDLAAGRLYVMLHSEKAPEGNLWGWLLAADRKK
jgi:hypothetical protein